MKLGELIKTYREENKISMEAFAKKCGLSKSYISMLENNRDPRGNKITPSIETIFKVSQAMGMEFDDVFNKLDANQNITMHSKVDESLVKTFHEVANALTGLNYGDLLKGVDKLNSMPDFILETDDDKTPIHIEFLKKDEKEFIERYRRLSEYGRRLMKLIMKEELERDNGKSE